MNTHIVNTSYNAGMAFTTDIDGHKIITDTGDEGGARSGPSPKRLMLAALAGCTGVDVVSILHKKRVVFSNLQINVEGGLSKDHPRIYKEVKITYKVSVAEADRSKMEKAVKLSLHKYCGVSAMFRAFAKESFEIIYL
jgi:putative redox protein